MLSIHTIDATPLTLYKLKALNDTPHTLVLAEEVAEKISKAFTYLQNKINASAQPIYGINTGFGSLCEVKISPENLSKLQENLVISHACGTGDKVPKDVVRWMLFLKIQSLSYGCSGVHLNTVSRLIAMYNANILPVVYTQGSLGASGDLAPLAHLALPLIGKGQVYFENKIQDTSKVLETLKWEPLNLHAKEGLALLNGTQFMSAYGVKCLLSAYRASYLSDLIAAVSIEAFNCNLSPFHPNVHKVRPHKGQVLTAARILEFLDGSEIAISENKKLQDPYSFRCVPQVHGASKDSLRYVSETILTEVNAVTDNPNIFVDDDILNFFPFIFNDEPQNEAISISGAQ